MDAGRPQPIQQPPIGPTSRPSILRREGLDPDAFVAAVSPLMQPFQLQSSRRNRFNLSSIRTASLSLVRIQSRTGFSIHTEPNPIPYKLDLPLATGFRDARSNSSFLPGLCGYMPRQGEAVKLALADNDKAFDMLCVVFDAKTLHDYALQLDPDWNAIDHPEDQCLGLSSPTGGSFQRYLRYIQQEILATPSLLQSPLILREFQTTLLAMVLELLPRRQGATIICSHRQDGASRRIVRSAEDLIHAHLGEPLSIGRISAMLNVHARTLHKAFRRHLDISPMAYVKARRLERVRRDLLEGDPHSHTITQTASRWGFNNPGHFAVDYRKAFGESPSATLRRAAGA